MKKTGKIACIFLFIFTLNIFYTFFISPFGAHESFNLDTKDSGLRTQKFIHADAREYVSMGVNLSKGLGMSFPLENPRATAMRMPGYPLLLSFVFRIFGINLNISLIIQCLLLTLFVYMCYLLAALLFSEKVAFLSLIIMGVCPNLKFYGCAYLGSETLAAIFLMGFMYIFLKSAEPLGFWQTIIGGILFAAALYTRPDFVFFVPFFSWWALQKKKILARGIITFFAVVFILMTPWIVRNYWVFKDFVPLTTGVGMVLSGAYNPDTVANNPGGWNSFNLEKAGISLEGKEEVAANRLRMAYGLKQMRSLNPRQIVKLTVWKMIRLWFPAQRVFRLNKGPVSLKSVLMSGRIQDISLLMVVNVLFTLIFFPVYVFFWMGMGRMVKTGTWLNLITMLFLYMNIVAILFWGSLRFRFIFEPFMIVVACWYFIERRRMQYKDNVPRKS